MTYFQFEADFVESLRCIPMSVRLKLDTCGVKLKLHHWHQFSQSERQQLVDMPCNTPAEIQQYRQYLQNLVQQHTGSPAKELDIEDSPAWLDPHTVPQATVEKAQSMGVNLHTQQWSQLTPLQRFALIKLSRKGHENKNFYPALQEFGLV